MYRKCKLVLRTDHFIIVTDPILSWKYFFVLLSDSKRYFNFWHWTFLSKLLTGHCYYGETPACICGWCCCCGWCWGWRLRQISVSTQGEARHAISLGGITAVVWPAGRVGEALVHAVLRCATIRLWSVFAASVAPGPVSVTCHLVTSCPSKSSWKMYQFLFIYLSFSKCTRSIPSWAMSDRPIQRQISSCRK